MRSALLGGMMTIALASPALAACADIENWNADGIVPWGFAQCGEALGEDGNRFTHCNRAFAYRAPEARDVFLALNAEIAACMGLPLAEAEDALVNHPDSYDLRVYETEAGAVSLSLKDKGALSQTLVFLRMEVNH